jgi:hypothetical protein
MYFDVASRSVPAHKVQLAGSDSMHRVVVIDRDRLAAERLEFDDSNGLVRWPVVVRTFPPPLRLRIDDVPVDVDIRHAGAVPDAGCGKALLCLLHRFHDLGNKP